MKQLLLILLLLSILIMVASCSDTEPPVSSSNSPLAVSPLNSPLDAPRVVDTEPRRGPDFFIDPTVQAGDTLVRGTGPAGVKIRIVDVSWAGEVKGTGEIGPDGTFTIEVSPIEAGNRIAIMLEDLGNSGFVYQDFRNNDNYQDLPMVGLLLYYLDIPAE